MKINTFIFSPTKCNYKTGLDVMVAYLRIDWKVKHSKYAEKIRVQSNIKLCKGPMMPLLSSLQASNTMLGNPEVASGTDEELLEKGIYFGSRSGERSFLIPEKVRNWIYLNLSIFSTFHAYPKTNIWCLASSIQSKCRGRNPFDWAQKQSYSGISSPCLSLLLVMKCL